MSLLLSKHLPLWAYAGRIFSILCPFSSLILNWSWELPTELIRPYPTSLEVPNTQGTASVPRGEKSKTDNGFWKINDSFWRQIVFLINCHCLKVSDDSYGVLPGLGMVYGCSYFLEESASRVYAFQVCSQIKLTVLHILLDKLKTKAFFFF